MIAPTFAEEKPLRARGHVEVSYLELLPCGLLGQQAIELVPKLRSRAPRSGGGPSVRIALAIPQTDAYHHVIARLDQEQGALVAWLPLGSRRCTLAPGLGRFLQRATLHTKSAFQNCAVMLGLTSWVRNW
jgi:hypothetical protein